MAIKYQILVDRLSDWKWDIEGIEIKSSDAYLSSRGENGTRPVRIINLCRNYEYLSGGYYCSLLAEARGDLPMPTVADIVELSRRNLYAFALPEFNALLQSTCKRLAEPPVDDFDLHVFFGYADDARFKRLAAEAFDVFRYPILKLSIAHKGGWVVGAIRPLGLHQITDELAATFEKAVRDFTRSYRKQRGDNRKPPLYDLAILYNPNEKLAPSNMQALERFIKAGRALRVDVDLIQRKDFQRLTEFDALFIRETTAINNHTFRFARKATVEGMPVIDDPMSILRCTNKVYQWEMMKRQGIPTPRTVPLDRRLFRSANVEHLVEKLGFPMVLKIPDGSFSRGMVKAENRDEVLAATARLFKHSRIILAQEFMYTSYDWRVGILGAKPLFVSQYKVARGHWQIVNHREDGSSVAGGFTTMAVDDAPRNVVETALRAAAQMGDGLYGVDIKENDRGVFVIEINDNPNIDYGVEDKVLKGDLYLEVIREFIRRIEANRCA